MRYTVPGYVIHHASSVFWAVLFERLLLDQPHVLSRAAAAALGVAGVAAGVDVNLTPKRMAPGFERQLSGRALTIMYGVFGLALFATHALRRGVECQFPLAMDGARNETDISSSWRNSQCSRHA